MTAFDVRNMVCVVLAGGRGKRMGSETCHKVCFPVGGRPAIVRAIDTYKEAGLSRFLVVVGQMADQVLETVAKAHPEVLFVRQTDPRGTGHAAMTAVDALAAQGHTGSVLIVMGDKVTNADTVRRLLRTYRESEPDVLLSVLPKVQETTAGRVIEDDAGAVLGIVECADIRRARETGAKLTVGGREFAAEEVERRGLTVNASMYAFRMGPLQRALRLLSPANAQGELYLTDTVGSIAREGRVERLIFPDPNDLMAFNTPAELLAIEKVLAEREGRPLVTFRPEQELSRSVFKPAREWLARLLEFGPGARATLARVYGGDEQVIANRRQAMVQTVEAFMGQFGPERNMVLCRAPGRINLMGRHVDHRGGNVNVMAINRETLLAASPREDDVVRLRDVRVNHFPNREFRIYDLLGGESWSNWMDFLESSTVRQVLEAAPGDWSHYVRAPLLRLQYANRDRRLKGMDCMLSGNIPMAAGLSSSSALVVAFAEAAVALNGFNLEMSEFIDLCGQGEWFVGSRGGAADHAAIRTGQLGHVTRIGFFPFQVGESTALPDGLRLLIANSGDRALKSAGARDVFNQRVACYEFALMLLKRRWPAAAGAERLRDLVPEALGVEPRDLYHALALLPGNPGREELRGLLAGENQAQVERLFGTHVDVGPYHLRGVALFGIAECQRSRRFGSLLADGDLDAIGRFMRASHDGDRCFRTGGTGMVPFAVPVDDAALAALAKANAPLDLQPGAYACSTANIDRLVDLANGVEGVVGAQLAGAGLGGCMMTLVKAEAVATLEERFRQDYYGPLEREPDLHVCLPVAGAGLVALPED